MSLIIEFSQWFHNSTCFVIIDDLKCCRVKLKHRLWITVSDDADDDIACRFINFIIYFNLLQKEDEICISQRNFAIAICIAGVILMICVIAAIAFIMARRRNPKTYSRTGSSLYSGPYTNTGYSHTS